MPSPIVFLLSIFLLSSCATSAEKQGAVEFDVLVVPENRSNNDSRAIEISYARIYAEKPGDKPPIVFLQGGPGGSSLSMVSFFSNSPLHQNHDIILFDARGTGKSGAFCPEVGKQFMELMAEDLTVEEEYIGTQRICNQCKTTLQKENVDLAGYNSLENAADLEALRKHLAIDQWIIFGGSYGTKLGLTYLREYPGHAEAAVLMSLFPLEVNMYEGFNAGLDGSLQYLFDSCQKDPKCEGNYPNLKDIFYALMEDLREKPKKISFRGSAFILNAQDALLLIHQMLYEQQLVAQVPRLIYAMHREDDQIVSNAISRTGQALSFINAPTYWSVSAFEELPFNEENAIVRDFEKFPYLKPGPAFLANDQKILAEWHEYRAGELENKPVTVETPILVVNGWYDPITPIASARKALEYLPNAQLIEFPYDGHTIFNPCFFDLFEDFVKNTNNELDPSCVKEIGINWR